MKCLENSSHTPYANLLNNLNRSSRVQTYMESVSDSARPQRTPQHILSAHFFYDVGDRARAARHFERAAEHDFADLPKDGDIVFSLATAADVCAYLLDVPRAKGLYERPPGRP